MQAVSTNTILNLPTRLWQYQSERFPLLPYSILIGTFSFCGIALSALLRTGEAAAFSISHFLVAWAVAFIFFLQLRVADEFKDASDDSVSHPNRPVPRGLVTLDELAAVAWAGALIQFVLTVWLSTPLLWFLFAAWVYLGLMTAEFFVPAWLRKRPVAYIWSHMLIMPFIDAYITACDWLPTHGTPSPGLIAFLLASFFNGMVIEIGRKIRAANEEEPNTYSSMWGAPTATFVWLVKLVCTAAFAILAAVYAGFPVPMVVISVIFLLLAIGLRSRLLSGNARGKQFENLSGAWSIAMYLAIGAVPLLGARMGF